MEENCRVYKSQRYRIESRRTSGKNVINSNKVVNFMNNIMNNFI